MKTLFQKREGEYYNFNHYMKVFKAYKRTSDSYIKTIHFLQTIKLIPKKYIFQFKEGSGLVITNHPKLGTKVAEGNEVAIIERVVLHYHNGWYIGYLLNFNGSHAFKMAENINCSDITTLNSIKEYKKNYKELK